MKAKQNLVLIVGPGGREHAIATKLAQSPRVSDVIVAPGNPGMGFEQWVCRNDEELAERCVARKVDLVVIGPDNPLAEGIVDLLRSRGLSVFGPTAQAAKIESSKRFAKEIMKEAGVPTAAFRVARSIEEAEDFLRRVSFDDHGWVLKADGLAFGKGVVVCRNREEAIQAVPRLLALSGELLLEEEVFGEEISCIGFCDGQSVALMDFARDYKRLLNGNLGPNTGGMGAFSPVGRFGVDFSDRVIREVYEPTVLEMRRRGIPFEGFLYAGLMVSSLNNDFRVLEFNARLGDPEAQVLLPRMDADLFDYCEAVVKRELSRLPSRVAFGSQHAVFVVGAAPGYPIQPQVGLRIEGPIQEESFFLAGVRQADHPQRSSNEAIVEANPIWETSGGRVFGALGQGESLATARGRAYAQFGRVRFAGMQFRTDISR